MTRTTAAASAVEEQAAPTPLAAPAGEPCVSCCRPAGAPFCPHCGEQRPSDRRYSLLHFAGEALEALTSVDNRLLRTLDTLVRRPGELTGAYTRGERRPYFGPLQLFLLVSVGFFVYASATGANTFSTPLEVHLYRTGHSDLATRMVAERLAARGISLAEYRTAFDAVSATQAKSLVIVMAPPFACLVALLTADRRRYFVHALVFALPVYAFVLVTTVGLFLAGRGLELVARALSVPVTSQRLDDVVSIVAVPVLTAYLAAALGRSYLLRRGRAWLSGVALLVAIVVLLCAYRLLLFYTAYSAT